jgi:hypothetical protein
MRLMIASEFRSQASPLKTVTRADGHAIGDSVLYHAQIHHRALMANLESVNTPTKARTTSIH